jgi:UDP-N-acetylglucosamine acyltransferase
MGRFIHSTSIIEDGALIGGGSYIGPYCHVGRDVVLGEQIGLRSHVVHLAIITMDKEDG